jgi:ribonucleotide reductase beta subunit family protein with ferritin-like domain
VYSELINLYVDSFEERTRLFNSIQYVPCVAQKARWAMKWIDSKMPFAFRLVAFAAVEGIFFSGSFAAIFWFKKRGLLPGLGFFNELISRDEGMHRDFAVLLFQHLKCKLNYEEIIAIIDECVSIEQEFMKDALSKDSLGMNFGMMMQYIKFVADHLFVSLGFPKYYDVNNPFDFMDLISLQGKTNFFEKRVGEYQKASLSKHVSGHVFSLTADF